MYNDEMYNLNAKLNVASHFYLLGLTRNNYNTSILIECSKVTVKEMIQVYMVLL